MKAHFIEDDDYLNNIISSYTDEENASDTGNTEKFLDKEKAYLKCLGSFTVENGQNKATLHLPNTM